MIISQREVINKTIDTKKVVILIQTIFLNSLQNMRMNKEKNIKNGRNSKQEDNNSNKKRINSFKR
jgi:hypothetical protein